MGQPETVLQKKSPADLIQMAMGEAMREAAVLRTAEGMLFNLRRNLLKNGDHDARWHRAAEEELELTADAKTIRASIDRRIDWIAKTLYSKKVDPQTRAGILTLWGFVGWESRETVRAGLSAILMPWTVTNDYWKAIREVPF